MTIRASPGNSVSRSGWATGISYRVATSFAGGASFFRPRPCGLSGFVRSTSISRRAASPSRIAAPNGPVAATAMLKLVRRSRSCDRSEDRLRAELRERPPSLVRRRPVDDEHTVEVVELVLDDPRLEALGLDLHRLARRRRGRHGHPERALHRHDHRGRPEREAALLRGLLLLRGGREAWVDERDE